jgi:hypothetical protein
MKLYPSLRVIVGFCVSMLWMAGNVAPLFAQVTPAASVGGSVIPYNPFAPAPSALSRTAPVVAPVARSVNAQGVATRHAFPCAADAVPQLIHRPSAALASQYDVGLWLKFSQGACTRDRYSVRLELSNDEGKTWLVPSHAKSGISGYQSQNITTKFQTSQRRHVVRFHLQAADVAAVLGPYLGVASK